MPLDKNEGGVKAQLSQACCCCGWNCGHSWRDSPDHCRDCAGVGSLGWSSPATLGFSVVSTQTLDSRIVDRIDSIQRLTTHFMIEGII